MVPVLCVLFLRLFFCGEREAARELARELRRPAREFERPCERERVSAGILGML